MDREALYRRSAAEAQRQADRALNADEREAWLRIAEGWLALVHRRPATPDERFAEVSKKRVTGQEESGELH